MQNVFKNQKPIVIVVMLAAAITAVAWQNKAEQPKKVYPDTISIDGGDTLEPRKRISSANEFRLDELDATMRDLESNMKRLNEQLKSLNFEKIDKQIQSSMAAIDFEKMNKEMKMAMKNIDMKKMHEDVDRTMLDVESKMKKIDLSKMKEEMKSLHNKLNSEEFKMKFDGEKIRKSVEEGMEKAKIGMEKAKEGMEKARTEMKFMTDLTNELEKDGWINKKGGYKVQLKDGMLFINGKEQSKETTEKYNKYYKEKKNFSISVNGDTNMSL
jgi:hypothetical protein